MFTFLYINSRRTFLSMPVQPWPTFVVVWWCNRPIRLPPHFGRLLSESLGMQESRGKIFTPKVWGPTSNSTPLARTPAIITNHSKELTSQIIACFESQHDNS